MSRGNYPCYEQLSLFTAEQLAEMERLPAQDPEPNVPIKPGVIASRALIDCLADAGYGGADPVYDFFTGKRPTHKPRRPNRRN